MDRRRLLLILAVFVAIIGTGLVFLYVRGVQKNAVETVDVLVATSNISASETYDEALGAGKLAMQPVPADYANSIPGVVTSTTALTGKYVTTDIFQGQAVTAGQFGTEVKPPSSTLAIPKGMMAISVNLTDPDRVAGNIENGSQVAIFVTGQLNASTRPAASAATGNTSVEATRLLLPKVTVLNVGSPQPPTTQTTTDSNGNQTTEQLPRTLLTVAVTQKDAQKVIVASKALQLTFGLLTSTSQVHPGPGTSTLVASLFR